ncbi:MAG: hypothetical protein ACFFBD_15115 [Candidatus Hodarchaeota archaeon]
MWRQRTGEYIAEILIFLPSPKNLTHNALQGDYVNLPIKKSLYIQTNEDFLRIVMLRTMIV